MKKECDETFESSWILHLFASFIRKLGNNINASFKQSSASTKLFMNLCATAIEYLKFGNCNDKVIIYELENMKLITKKLNTDVN